MMLYTLGDWQKRIYQIAQDFRSDSRRNNRRIVHYVTVIATQKLDDKDKQVGIFFDRNRLSIISACVGSSSKFYH